MTTFTSSTVGRRTLLAGLGAASLAGLAGCNLGTGGGGGGENTLNVWGGVPGESGPDDLCDAFMEANPDIKVTYTRYPNDDAGNVKLDSSLAGGVPIDVFISYAPAKLFQRAANGLALDITDRIEGDSELKQFGPSAETPGNFFSDGKAFSVPAQKSPTIVVLNQTMLDEAGIELGDSWTFDEYQEITDKLSKDNVFGSYEPPQKAPIILGPDKYYADGGKRSNFDHPALAADLKHHLAEQKAKRCMDRKSILAEKLEVFAHTPFLTNRAAMHIEQIFILRYISDTTEYPHDFVTRAMPHPTIEEGGDEWQRGTLGDNLCISKSAKDPDLAWEFIKFWMMNGKYNVPGGRLPSVVGNSTTEELIAGLLGPERDKLYDVASFEHAIFGTEVNVPVDTIFTAATQIDELLDKRTDEVLLGDRSVDSWVKTMTKEADAAIASA